MKISGGDGSTIDKAIIISDCNNTEGVHQEYVEVRKRFGEYRLIRQVLLEQGDKMYDKLELELKNGEKIELYFDITPFFGKY
ncbi:MAG: hypothetical protein ACFFEN_11885 [Candidatus Thorarchaeota archaeon]